MERVAITSVVRRAPSDVPSAWLRVVELASGRVLAAVPLPEGEHRAHDPNPRGGMRGARGLALWGEHLAVATNDRLMVVDAEWRTRRLHTHPWLGGIHDLLADGDDLWVTATESDLVVRLDPSGSVVDSWSWRAANGLGAELGFRSVPPFNPRVDYRDPRQMVRTVADLGHVNAVAHDGDALLVSLGLMRLGEPLAWRHAKAQVADTLVRAGLGGAAVRASRWRRDRRLAADERRNGPSPYGRLSLGATGFALVRVRRGADGTFRPGRAEVVLRRPAGVPFHNIERLDDLLVLCDSGGSGVVAVEPGSGETRMTVALPGASPFPRGLLALGGGRFLTGAQQPLALHEIDLPAGAVRRTIPLPGHPEESVYAICAVPDRFGDPAALPAAADDFLRAA